MGGALNVFGKVCEAIYPLYRTGYLREVIGGLRKNNIVINLRNVSEAYEGTGGINGLIKKIQGLLAEKPFSSEFVQCNYDLAMKLLDIGRPDLSFQLFRNCTKRGHNDFIRNCNISELMERCFYAMKDEEYYGGLPHRKANEYYEKALRISNQDAAKNLYVQALHYWPVASNASNNLGLIFWDSLINAVTRMGNIRPGALAGNQGVATLITYAYDNFEMAALCGSAEGKSNMSKVEGFCQEMGIALQRKSMPIYEIRLEDTQIKPTDKEFEGM